MWKLAQTAKETCSRPSSLLCIRDRLAAYQFDNAVIRFRIIMENALQETVEVGVGTSRRVVARYTLQELLDPDFKFAREQEAVSPAMFKRVDGAFYDEVGE